MFSLGHYIPIRENNRLDHIISKTRSNTNVLVIDTFITDHKHVIVHVVTYINITYINRNKQVMIFLFFYLDSILLLNLSKSQLRNKLFSHEKVYRLS